MTYDLSMEYLSARKKFSELGMTCNYVSSFTDEVREYWIYPGDHNAFLDHTATITVVSGECFATDYSSIRYNKVGITRVSHCTHNAVDLDMHSAMITMELTTPKRAVLVEIFDTEDDDCNPEFIIKITSEENWGQNGFKNALYRANCLTRAKEFAMMVIS